MLANPWYPSTVTVAEVPSVPSIVFSTGTCWAASLKLARKEPMEKPASGVTAAIAVLLGLVEPPKATCGTDCDAVTFMALHGWVAGGV